MNDELMATAKAMLSGTAREYYVKPDDEREWFRDITEAEVAALKPGDGVYVIATVSGNVLHRRYIAPAETPGEIQTSSYKGGGTDGSASTSDALRWLKVPL